MQTAARGQRWGDCDTDVRAFVERVIEGFREQLGAALVGIYLHGSLAMGCYRRAKSDVDLMIVVRERLSKDMRRKLASLSVALSDARPTTGDLELSVIQLQHARQFVHPLPFEMHYSSDWKDAIRSGAVDFALERSDRDLAAHCRSLVTRGVGLFGLPIAEVFGPVATECFMDAVLDDFAWLVEDDHILESPFYCVLNCCRVLQLLTNGAGKVVSKEEGARWGLEHVPPEQQAIVRQALDCYCSSKEVSPEQRRTGGVNWDAEALRRFRDFAAREAARLREAEQSRI